MTTIDVTGQHRGSRVSVVIPYGGGGLPGLQRQLDALDRQEGAQSFEVVVAANSRLALTELNSIRSAYRALVVVDASARRGPSFARNVGWRRATGELILFCDADDVVSPDWVGGMCLALSASDVTGSILRQEPPRDGLPGESELVEVPIQKPGDVKYFASCSIAFRRGALELLGGWDEDLLATEDVDICHRAAVIGLRAAASQRGSIAYQMRSDFRSIYSQFRGYGQGDIQFYRKHGYKCPLSLLVNASFIGKLILLGPAAVRRRHRRSLASKAGLLVGWINASARRGTSVPGKGGYPSPQHDASR